MSLRSIVMILSLILLLPLSQRAMSPSKRADRSFTIPNFTERETVLALLVVFHKLDAKQKSMFLFLLDKCYKHLPKDLMELRVECSVHDDYDVLI